jgi:hypothetical protein
MIEEDDEDRVISSKDFMNDFASDDFLTKNIRVRPVSGRTQEGGGDVTKSGGDMFG